MSSPHYIGDTLVPSTFLPALPRSQTTLSPLSPSLLLAHISVLRGLYIPPVIGGFRVSRNGDVDVDLDSSRGRGRGGRERRFSAGLSETMQGLGLDLDLDPGSQDAIVEEDEDSEQEEQEEEEEESAHLEPFERDWSEKWLGGVVRRAQTWLEEHDNTEDEESRSPGRTREVREVEVVLRDATAVLAMMAGTSAAGSLTRHLLFPIHASLAPGLKSLEANLLSNPALSPQTTNFLSSLATSPASPKTAFLHGVSLSMSPSSPRNTFLHSRRRGSMSHSPSSELSISPTRSFGAVSQRQRRRRQPAVPILLHDAPMSDHLSVGVQTWGSAILLGRRMALNPGDFGLFPNPSSSGSPTRGIRVLELGAGTGLLSILCRKILDLHAATGAQTNAQGESGYHMAQGDGLVVATDFLTSVLDNLKICVDLNFPPLVSGPDAEAVDTAVMNETGGQDVAGIESGTDISPTTGIHIAKLDWTTFPAYMEAKLGQGPAPAPVRAVPVGIGADTEAGQPRRRVALLEAENSETEQEEEMSRFIDKPFDLVLASDCVYDISHAELLRSVASWVLRLPDPEDGDDQGGTFHILSPIRPTFTPELESIDKNFPPLPQGGDQPKRLGEGEGLGTAAGLRLGSRNDGKLSVRGKKGEGRVDETAGYWWWEVGWG